MNKRKAGNNSEEIAVSFLEKNHYLIRERNFSCRIGEIDIIAEENQELVFVEVRSKSYESFGRAIETINRKKQKKIRRVAEYYLMKYGLENRFCRFDVVGIDKNEKGEREIELIKAAF